MVSPGTFNLTLMWFRTGLAHAHRKGDTAQLFQARPHSGDDGQSSSSCTISLCQDGDEHLSTLPGSLPDPSPQTSVLSVIVRPRAIELSQRPSHDAFHLIRGKEVDKSPNDPS
ncbi:hypothetical protein JOB18_010509 [Solea senegalensis]|uniref:Uncharacterized protein n=1 Tax=Solea senegalensis TaxID=28829 RepID=A0AAV6RGF3_SOLSE|nr:hypothetical protein JOB18_010509 [Solea senegalensis]